RFTCPAEKAQPPSRPDLSATVKLLNRLGEFFNRSTSILIAEARIALEPSKRISRVEIAGGQSKPFQNGWSTVVAGVPPANLLTAADTAASTARTKNLRVAIYTLLNHEQEIMNGARGFLDERELLRQFECGRPCEVGTCRRAVH